MIIKLSDPRASDTKLSGGKGSELSRLISRGLPVPPGFVITTDAFAEFFSNSGFDMKWRAVAEIIAQGNDSESLLVIESFQQEMRHASLPPGLVNSIKSMLVEYQSQWGRDTQWAVRSSAVAEDLAGASFAGQYDTVLAVSELSAVCRAVLRCWASFFNAHAIRYKRDKQILEKRAAVVVQRLVNADTAGVCFSVNPVNGNTDQIVINSNYGLGESVVSGTVTPDTFVSCKKSGEILSEDIGDKAHMVVATAGGAETVSVSASRQLRASLEPGSVRKICELAKKIEDFEKQAVDIEWAFSSGKLFLLQSRAITTITTPEIGDSSARLYGEAPGGWTPELDTIIDPKYPLYTNGNISEVLPGCITPLSWSYIAPIIDFSFRTQLHQMGGLTEKVTPMVQLRTIGWFYFRPYLCISYFVEAANNTPGLTPDTYLEEFVGPQEKETPAFLRSDLLPHRLLLAARVMTVGIWHLLILDSQARRCHQIVEDELAETGGPSLKQWSSRKLVDSLEFTPEYGWPSVVHIWASSYASLGFSKLRALSSKWLNDTAGGIASSLITGIGVLPSAEPAHYLYALAMRVKRSADMLQLFSEETNQDVSQAICEKESMIDDEFLAAWKKFLDSHGHRGILEAEFMNPCWREDPAQVVGMIKNYLVDGARSPEEIQQRQKNIQNETETRVMSSLSWVRRLSLKMLLNVVRHFIQKREELKNLIALRADRARRIYQELAGRLVASELLEKEEQIYFLSWSELKDLIVDNRADPSIALKVEQRKREFHWAQKVKLPRLVKDKAVPVDISQLSGDKRMSGVGVYPGIISGRARVVLDPRTEMQIEPGEILIAPVTDAGWTPLFINAAALVVEVGGLLSHGSVVAREYGLPAVVGVEGATQRIRTGDRVYVDGLNGTVALIEE